MNIPDGFYQYTVCGLRIDAGPPEEWVGLTSVAVADSAETAVPFAEQAAAGDVDTDGKLMCTGLALACVHFGPVPIVGKLNIAYEKLTDGEVEAERRGARNSPYRMYTICGMDRRTFVTLWYAIEARSPELAWIEACTQAADEGFFLLRAAIHEDEQPRIDGFPYADPLAGTDDEMRLTVTDTWGLK